MKILRSKLLCSNFKSDCKFDHGHRGSYCSRITLVFPLAWCIYDGVTDIPKSPLISELDALGLGQSIICWYCHCSETHKCGNTDDEWEGFEILCMILNLSSFSQMQMFYLQSLRACVGLSWRWNETMSNEYQSETQLLWTWIETSSPFKNLFHQHRVGT